MWKKSEGKERQCALLMKLNKIMFQCAIDLHIALAGTLCGVFDRSIFMANRGKVSQIIPKRQVPYDMRIPREKSMNLVGPRLNTFSKIAPSRNTVFSARLIACLY